MARVYFIKPVGMDGPIKIGCSRSPDGRLDTLDFWSPFALELIAEIEGDFNLERRFHARFLHCHDRREWFRADPEILATVGAINAGTFDPETLPEPVRLPSFRPKKNTLRTPERRYYYSVTARFRSAGVCWTAMRQALGDDIWCAANWLDRQSEIEAIITTHGGKPSKIFPVRA